MDRNVFEVVVVLAAGLLVSVGSYVALSDSAAVLFGFIYVMLIPLLHEIVNVDKHI